MSEIIVVTSGKGGVGKTTVTANLGAGLSMLGGRVVLIDTDIGLRNLDVVMGLENRMEYITFSLHATKEFIRLAPAGTSVYYLDGNLSPKELKELGCAGPDYHYTVFRKHPEWIRECHDLGMKVNAWTVNKTDDMKWLIDRKVDFITTNEPVQLQNLLKK